MSTGPGPAGRQPRSGRRQRPGSRRGAGRLQLRRHGQAGPGEDRRQVRRPAHVGAGDLRRRHWASSWATSSSPWTRSGASPGDSWSPTQRNRPPAPPGSWNGWTGTPHSPAGPTPTRSNATTGSPKRLQGTPGAPPTPSGTPPGDRAVVNQTTPTQQPTATPARGSTRGAANLRPSMQDSPKTERMPPWQVTGPSADKALPPHPRGSTGRTSPPSAQVTVKIGYARRGRKPAGQHEEEPFNGNPAEPVELRPGENIKLHRIRPRDDALKAAGARPGSQGDRASPTRPGSCSRRPGPPGCGALPK